MDERTHQSATLELEFTIEPFVASQPGPHVLAAHDACTAAGLELEPGPFGSRASGPSEQVLGVLETLIRASLSEGGSRISMQIRRPNP